MGDYQNAAALHNGAVVIDVDTSSWGEQAFPSEYYNFTLVRHELNTVERRPGKGHVRLSMDPERIVFVRPGEVEHVIPDDRPGGIQRVSMAALLFKPELIKGAFGSLEMEGLRDLRDPVSANLLRAAVHLDENSDPLLVDQIVMAITSRIRGMSQPEIKHKGRIELAIAYINERLERKITLAEIASASAMSSFHFLRTFKEVTGMTPLAYVTAKRVERAKAILAKTDHPMSAVSDMCGFSSQSHFSSSFKANTGASPRAFRISMGRKAALFLIAASHWIYEMATEPISIVPAAVMA